MGTKHKPRPLRPEPKRSDHLVSIFGGDDPRRMPDHFFSRAIHIDYDTAERADTSRQDYGVAPRYWYVDATFICLQCRQEFVWTRSEQRFWFEELRLWIDAHPLLCHACRATKRKMTEVRRSYDNGIGAALACKTIAEKQSMKQTLNDYQSLAGVLPPRMADNLDLLERQIQNLQTTEP